MKAIRMSLLGIAILISNVGFAVTYYVSPNGNDQNSGLSRNDAFLTLQYAADKTLPGDSVIVAAGSYVGFYVAYRGGTPSQYITFHAEPGATVNHRCPWALAYPKAGTGINLESASYITVEGFTVYDPDGSITNAGIRAVLDTGVVIRGNTIDKCGEIGILTGQSEGAIIENNICSRSINQHGIYYSNEADNAIIRGNIMWGNIACGFHLNAGSEYGEGTMHNILIENNIVYDNGRSGGSAIDCDGASDSRIINNLVYDNHASGISLFGQNSPLGSKNNIVANNTVIMASDARWAMNIQNFGTEPSSGNKLYNNIFYTSSLSPLRGSINVGAESLTGLVSDYNLLTDKLTPEDGTGISLADWRSKTGQDLNSHVITDINSLFINMSANDYHLSSNSQAIDKGTVTLASTDIEGNPRPSGVAFDIGAYEYQLLTATTHWLEPKIKNNYLVMRVDSRIVFQSTNNHNLGNLLITNTQGQIVHTDQVAVQSHTWDISKVEEGLYIYKLNNTSGKIFITK